MMSAMKLSAGGMGTRSIAPTPAMGRPAAAGPRLAQGSVSCKAATAWDSWTSYISKHRTDSQGKAATKAETSINKELAAILRESASSFTSKYIKLAPGSGAPAASADFHLTHIGTAMNVTDLPKDLHERLEVIANLQLKEALGLGAGEVDSASISFTTSDVEGALCVSGITMQEGLDKTAYVAVVATETERQASWSRLEGLMLHWGCSDSASGSWGLPPEGWQASPNKVMDAGGAWQCGFEKQMIAGPEGNTAIYVVLLKLPLRGILKAGGIVFVLKATAGQNTRWLKDEDTKKDFFIDLTRLPVTKA